MSYPRKVVAFLREEGAQPSEAISQHLKIAGRRMWTTLKQMEKSGSVKTIEQNEKVYYFIDQECVVPQHMTYRDVLGMWG